MSKRSFHKAERHFDIIVKNAFEDLRIDFSKYKGNDLIHLRIYELDKAKKVYKRTKKGVCLRVSKLPELIRALQEAWPHVLKTSLSGAHG